MIEFFRRIFGQPSSSATAKERLRLVLMTDHLELAPEMIEAMKRDLVDVISRHVEVDRDKIEVNFERQDRALAMLANIPILSVNRPGANGALEAPEPVEASGAPAVGQPPLSEPPVAETPSAKPPKDDSQPRVRKRRRRAKKAANAEAAPAAAG